MCVRFSLNPAANDIQEMINFIERQDDARPLNTGEIFPADAVPVLAASYERIKPYRMIWGFPGGKNGIVTHVDAETILRVPLLRPFLLESPVVIPTTGFYKWRGGRGRYNEKYLVRKPGKAILYLAGLCNARPDPEQDTEPQCFVILTTAATRYMARFHPHMPVLLRTEEVESWLSGRDITSILRRAPFPVVAERVR